MITPDLINGLFEILGAPFIIFSIVNLYKAKEVKGISWVHAAFITLWGFWNLYYYPQLDQWISFVGAIMIVVVNSIWVSLMIYYIFIRGSSEDKENYP